MVAKKFPIIDIHQDIAYNAIYASGKDISKRGSVYSGRSKAGVVVHNNTDIPRLKKGNVRLVFGSTCVFTKKELKKLLGDNAFKKTKIETLKTGWEGAMELIDYYHDIIRNNGDLVLVKSYDDYKKLGKSRKIGLLLHLEGIDYFNSDNDFEKSFNLGVRSIGMTWNTANCFGGGSDSASGLTKKGRAAIKMMEEMGIIIDLAHSSKKTFFDVTRIAKKPLVVSHTACCSVHAHSRNLTDDQIEMIAKKNGVIGIMNVPAFLGGNHMDDYIKHIIHIKKLVGVDYVCFGSDFDGRALSASFIEDFEDVGCFKNVIKALMKSGFSEKEIKKISHKNMERVLTTNI